MDGFHLGQALRQYDPRGFIVYVTAYDHLAFKTFQFHLEALDYIIKDRPDKMAERIQCCLDVIVTRVMEEKDDKKKYFTIKIMDIVKHIPISEIYYFETSPRTHRIILYAKNEMIDFMGKLQDIENELTSDFMRIHRSYLVNLSKIKSLDLKNNMVFLTNGQSCFFTRKTKTALVKMMDAYERHPDS